MANENELDPAIRSALDGVLNSPGDQKPEFIRRLRNLLVNSLADNYDLSDVRAVIELAMPDRTEGENTEDQGDL